MVLKSGNIWTMHGLAIIMVMKLHRFAIHGILMMLKFPNIPTNLLPVWILLNMDVSILRGIKGQTLLVSSIENIFIDGELQGTNKVRFWYFKI